MNATTIEKFLAVARVTKPKDRTEKQKVILKADKLKKRAEKTADGFVLKTISDPETGGRPPEYRDDDVRLAETIFHATGEYKEVSTRMKEQRGIDLGPNAWRKQVNRLKRRKGANPHSNSDNQKILSSFFLDP